MRKYHKAERVYLGLTNPQIVGVVAQWRADLDSGERVQRADQL